MPRVDVVVVSWNVRDDLVRCIESVNRSTGVGVHVVVVDNDSADGSASVVQQRHPEVNLVRNRENLGFARATNQGIAMGESPMVLLLNPDTEVGPDSVAKLAGFLEEHPEYAAVAPRLIDPDGHVQHSAYRFPSIGISLLIGTGIAAVLPRVWRASLLLEGSWTSDVERDVPWVLGAALLVRRSALEQVGLLDESFHMYTEDLEWCDRAWRRGMPIRFLPSATVVHAANRSGSQRYGANRTSAYLRSTMSFGRRRHGLLWTAVFYGVNAAATTSRYGLYRLLNRLRPTPARRYHAEFWAAYARFYLGRTDRLS
ncbi:MAG: glycosyltransferase family 2 protein [Candidatus Dormibacteraeota bacterium]|nr:glycosyltransferase family 2 protein [Candidatus Dormibacteraeota bacterium]